MENVSSQKILLLTDGIFPFVTGGMQKHSFYLAKYLLKNGFDVTLMHCVLPAQKAPSNEEVKNAFGNEIKGNLTSFCLPFPKALKFPGHYLYESWRLSKQYYKKNETILNQFDYIYIQGFAGWYFLKKLKSGAVKGRVVLNFHGLEMFQLSAGIKEKIRARLLSVFVKKNLRRAPFIHSLGGKLNTILIHKLGIDPSKIITVPIGIEKKWVCDFPNQQTSDTLHFAFIGRNERRKGFPELAKVCEKLALKGYKFHLHVVGPFEKKENPMLTYHGLVKDENEIIKILDSCQVFICPSYAEGMPTVILEAMSRGCCIAATNVGAVCEQVDHSNGWLYTPGNLSQLESCIISILEAPKNEIDSKRQESIKKIKSTFLWDNIIKQLFG